MDKDAPKAGRFRTRRDPAIKEADIVSYLAILDSGLSEPEPLPPPAKKVKAIVVKRAK